MKSPTHRLRGFVAAAVAVAVMTLSTACGGGGSTEKVNGMDQVNVGVIPIIDVAAVYLGVRKGFFKQQHIQPRLKQAEGGAAILPAVLSGQTQFGFSNVVSLMIARSKKLPIKVLTPGVASTGEQDKDFAALVVPKDSPVHTAKDLVGRKVGTNTLDNICTVSADTSVRKAGGDPAKMKYVEIDPPSTVEALKNGTLDGSCLTEPFLSQYLHEGGRAVASNYVDVLPHLVLSAYFTSENLAKSDPDLVKRFTKAMQTSLSYADQHPDEVRQIVTTYTKIPPAALKKAVMPRFPATFDSVGKQSLTRIGDAAKLDGVVPKTFDPASVLR